MEYVPKLGILYTQYYVLVVLCSDWWERPFVNYAGDAAAPRHAPRILTLKKWN
jgi:hypothetical protein